MGAGIIVIVIILVVIVIIGVVAYFAYQARQKRAAEIRLLATSQSWQYAERDDAYARQWEGKPFTRGGKVRNIVSGQHRGRRFSAFAYSYTTSSYNGTTTVTQTHSFAVFAVDLPSPVPNFSVAPEGVFGGKVAEAFGFERVNIPDDDFNNTFKVTCDDQQFGLRVLQPLMVNLLKSIGPLTWRFTGQTMLMYEKGTFEADMLPQRLDVMCDVLDKIPPEVWQRPYPPGPTSRQRS